MLGGERLRQFHSESEEQIANLQDGSEEAGLNLLEDEIAFWLTTSPEGDYVFTITNSNIN